MSEMNLNRRNTYKSISDLTILSSLLLLIVVLLIVVQIVII